VVTYADPLTGQWPLVHVLESDDLDLARLEDVAWFPTLRGLNWRTFFPVACEYYQGLWNFNQNQALELAHRAAADQIPNLECKADATRRLLGERPTLFGDAPILVPPKPETLKFPSLDPREVAPGRTPFRIAGRAPKCFFALFKSFIGVTLRNLPPEPDYVHSELVNNPSFARACGFTFPIPGSDYRQSDVPSLRKIQQFDQIMSQLGLWDHAAVAQIRASIKNGLIKRSDALVHDTTHYPANSGFQSVEVPSQAESSNDVLVAPDPRQEQEQEQEQTKAEAASDRPSNEAQSLGSTDNEGKRTKGSRKQEKSQSKARRKSQPKTTKNCRCPNRESCPHDWVSADPGAGTVVKHGKKIFWAHKASTLAFADQEGILLDAVAMTDAASHDSKSLVPHLERLKLRFPELFSEVRTVLDDAAADIPALKQEVQAKFAIDLLTSSNPRGRKPLTEDLPRGIEKITPAGTPVCRAGLPFDFIGCRHEPERFLFQAPNDENGASVCSSCPFKTECCNEGSEKRHLSIPFDKLPWIDPNQPQLSTSFRKKMAKRTVIERIHKLMKFDYGSAALTRRGDDAFQARLDKTLLVMHVVLAGS
jgi:hypothetical protein